MYISLSIASINRVSGALLPGRRKQLLLVISLAVICKVKYGYSLLQHCGGLISFFRLNAASVTTNPTHMILSWICVLIWEVAWIHWPLLSSSSLNPRFWMPEICVSLRILLLSILSSTEIKICVLDVKSVLGHRNACVFIRFDIRLFSNLTAHAHLRHLGASNSHNSTQKIQLFPNVWRQD